MASLTSSMREVVTLGRSSLPLAGSSRGHEVSGAGGESAAGLVGTLIGAGTALTPPRQGPPPKRPAGHRKSGIAPRMRTCDSRKRSFGVAKKLPSFVSNPGQCWSRTVRGPRPFLHGNRPVIAKRECRRGLPFFRGGTSNLCGDAILAQEQALANRGRMGDEALP